jgi:hypothetical protein
MILSQTVTIETIERDPRYCLEQLLSGQTLMLVNSDGAPVAMLVSLRSPATGAELSRAWDAQWEDLAQRVSRAWKSEKGAVEIVAEIRR